MTQPSDVSSTLASRGKSHGDFQDNGKVMQHFKAIARQQDGWYALAPHQAEAIDMILHKLGRILCGNPNFADHWHDIAGYATLVENIITTGKSHPTTEPIKSGCTD